MDFNSLITTFSSLLPSSSFMAQTIVSAFISAIFSSRSSKKEAIYGAKVDLLNKIIYDLVEDNTLTATEYLKCKNLADIAQLADQARAKRAKGTLDEGAECNEQPKYNFDWFWRFFERAGYASDLEMKKLWASVLNGEIDHSGQFSYKAIETLFLMNEAHAKLFREMARFSFNTPFGECILVSSDELYENTDVNTPCAVDGESDMYSVLAAAYGITNEKVMLLDEYGLVSSMLTTSSFHITHDPQFITNDYYAIQIQLRADCQLESLEFEICGHRFSSVARQLFAVLDDEPSVSFFLDYARLIKRRFPEIDVSVFSIASIDENGLTIEDSTDWLEEPSSKEKTRISTLEDENFTLV